MKKVTLFVLALFLCVAGFCQSRVEVGVELGPTLAFLRGNSIISKYHSPRLGYGGGVAVQYNFNETFSIRSIAGIERKGSLQHVTLMNSAGFVEGTFEQSNHFDYLTLPVLFRATFGKKVKVFANAGPYAAYLVHTAAGLTVFETDRSLETNKALFRSFDFGVSAGVGMRLPVGERVWLSFEARDNLGLTNISSVPVYGGKAIRNNSTCLIIGCAYRL